MATKEIGIVIEMFAAILGVLGGIFILSATEDMIMLGWALLTIGIILGIIGAALIKLG